MANMTSKRADVITDTAQVASDVGTSADTANIDGTESRICASVLIEILNEVLGPKPDPAPTVTSEEAALHQLLEISRRRTSQMRTV